MSQPVYAIINMKSCIFQDYIGKITACISSLFFSVPRQHAADTIRLGIHMYLFHSYMM